MNEHLASFGVAPGKVILFGEHAVNRGQTALAAAVGLRATCKAASAESCAFASGNLRETASAEEVRELTERVDRLRESEDFDQIRKLAASDYFAPQKYILGGMFPETPGFSLEWTSEIPAASGLGSGAAAFTAMVAALLPWLGRNATVLERAEWALRGDILAHGGIASGLDTQTSLLGEVIEYTGAGLARRIPCAPGLVLVIAHTGVRAPTSEVNSRVREWAKPKGRLAYFETVGVLVKQARAALEAGKWVELGKLFNLNQLVLEKIGVSCPEADRLIEAALSAGAYGAKISGSGGGGIVIALGTAETRETISQAMQRAGGQIFSAPLPVPGAAKPALSHEPVA